MVIDSGKVDEEFDQKVHTIEVDNQCENVQTPPLNEPTQHPTKSPTQNPTKSPTQNPTKSPTENPTQSPTRNPTNPPSPNNVCKDVKKGRWRIKGRKGPRRTCKIHAKKRKCNSRTSTGEKVWQLCQKSCNRCDYQ